MKDRYYIFKINKRSSVIIEIFPQKLDFLGERLCNVKQVKVLVFGNGILSRGVPLNFGSKEGHMLLMVI